jgi:PAS domain S-box-containing protein
MLQAALEKTGHDRTAVLVDFLRLFPDKEPLIIASSLPETNLPPAVIRHRMQTGHASGRASSPLFAFGNAYALAMTPEPAFLSSYPRRSAWLVLLGGVVASIGVAALVGLLSNNRNYLKAQIRARTARLSQSEIRLRAITDSAQDAILMLNPEGGISYWNPAAERIFGYTSAEALGQELHAIFAPPQYHEAHQAALPELWLNGQGPAVGKTTDLEGRRKDGRKISLQLSVSTVQIEGRWHGVGILRDITERKRAEDALQASEAQLAGAMDQAQLAHWELDAATQIFTFNDRFYALYGTSAEREGGYRMPAEVYAREFLPPEEQHLVHDADVRLLSGETEELQLEHPIRRRNGELRHIVVRVTVVRDASGRVVGICGANQDITERKRDEETLRLQGEMLSNMSEGVSLVRARAAVIVLTNAKYDQMLGYAAGELAGQHLSVVNAPDSKSAEVVTAAILHELQAKGSWEGEVVNRRKDNTRIWCRATVSGFKHSVHGDVWVCVNVDITERKQAEEALRAETVRRRILFEQSPDGIVIIDPQTAGFLEFNTAAHRQLGYSREAFAQLTLPAP